MPGRPVGKHITSGNMALLMNKFVIIATNHEQNTVN